MCGIKYMDDTKTLIKRKGHSKLEVCKLLEGFVDICEYKQ